MKTLKFILLFPIVLFQLEIKAQDTIYVSHNKITAIQFPATIESPVIAGNNVIAQIKKEDLLVLKAAGKQFPESRLEVKTIDGKSYTFPLAFSYGRAGRLSKVRNEEVRKRDVETTVSSVQGIAYQLAEQNNTRVAANNKNGKVKSLIGNITVSDNKLFYKILVKNRSNISYDIDFIRFYIRDLKTAKRTVTQEQEIYPIYSLGLENSTVEGKSTGNYVFAFNKFPITKDKAVFVEVYEKNGGRHQNLKLKQNDIENAQPFK